MLEVKNLAASYGPISALSSVSLSVAKGEIVAIVGANGVGKTTLLRCIAGLLRPTAGTITFNGEDVTRMGSHNKIPRGIALVPEGRRLFHDLSVRENLVLGTLKRKDRTKSEIEKDLESVLQLFPILRERSAQLAGTLSGGQQQMVAVARGLMSRPALLLLDEPSLGLAPLVVRQMFRTFAELRTTLGTSLILVEQDAQAAFSISDRGYVMQRGRISLSGSAKELLSDPRTREIYFGKTA
jgi:branched-chain amino acid transport system ATP-binding protein